LNEPVEALPVTNQRVTVRANRHERAFVSVGGVRLDVMHLSADAENSEGCLRRTADETHITPFGPDRIERGAVRQRLTLFLGRFFEVEDEAPRSPDHRTQAVGADNLRRVVVRVVLESHGRPAVMTPFGGPLLVFFACHLGATFRASL
jgi:hypothetical protein